MIDVVTRQELDFRLAEADSDWLTITRLLECRVNHNLPIYLGQSQLAGDKLSKHPRSIHTSSSTLEGWRPTGLVAEYYPATTDLSIPLALSAQTSSPMLRSSASPTATTPDHTGFAMDSHVMFADACTAWECESQSTSALTNSHDGWAAVALAELGSGPSEPAHLQAQDFTHMSLPPSACITPAD